MSTTKNKAELNKLRGENKQLREALVKIKNGCDFPSQVALKALDPKAHQKLMGAIVDNALADW